MEASELKRKWQKELDKDTPREEELDQVRLEEKDGHSRGKATHSNHSD